MRALHLVVILAFVGAPAVSPRAPAFAQHETASDLVDGERAFRSSCANCHGPDGDLIGGIDLGRGQFRRPLSDEELVRIIRTGIPNTPMPPSQMSVAQASTIVAYLRSTAAARRAGVVAGDPDRGRAVFDGKGGCARCHRLEGTGSRLGPDLTGIGSRRGALELERALVEPGADVDPASRFVQVVLKDGTSVTGRLLGHDTFTVQLLDSREMLRSFDKQDLRSQTFLGSPMPSFRGVLTPQELADVVRFLSTQAKGR